MDFAAALRARVSDSGGPELQQAILRIVIGTLILLYLLWSPSGGSTEERRVITVTTVWFGLAILMFAWTWMWPAVTKSRRWVAMLLDVGITTFAMFNMGSQGAFLPGVYLFLTFGNGFRFGRLYLHLCQFFCLAGFVLVGVMVPSWRHNPEFFVGWMISLVLLPFYVGTLTERIRRGRTKAEEELKRYLAEGTTQ